MLFISLHVVWIWLAFRRMDGASFEPWEHSELIAACKYQARGRFLSAGPLVAFASGLVLWSWRPTVAILLPAGVCLHMHRLVTLSRMTGCTSQARAYLCGTAAGDFVLS